MKKQKENLKKLYDRIENTNLGYDVDFVLEDDVIVNALGVDEDLTDYAIRYDNGRYTIYVSGYVLEFESEEEVIHYMQN